MPHAHMPVHTAVLRCWKCNPYCSALHHSDLHHMLHSVANCCHHIENHHHTENQKEQLASAVLIAQINRPEGTNCCNLTQAAQASTSNAGPTQAALTAVDAALPNLTCRHSANKGCEAENEMTHCCPPCRAAPQHLNNTDAPTAILTHHPSAQEPYQRQRPLLSNNHPSNWHCPQK